MNLLKRLRNLFRRPTWPGTLPAAADRLQAAVDGFAAAYGQHHPTEVSGEAARRVYADLARITRDLDALRRSGSAVTS